MEQPVMVQRRFQGAYQHEHGEVLDAAGIRTARSLKTRRYLAELPRSVEIVACHCGRRWAGVEKMGQAGHGADVGDCANAAKPRAGQKQKATAK